MIKARKYIVPVRCVETGKVYKSQAQAARELGIHRYGISNVITGKQKTAGGYHWEIVE
jgi:DNA-directed RNA polymerase subunit N (RpoN/RPB10)